MCVSDFQNYQNTNLRAALKKVNIVANGNVNRGLNPLGVVKRPQLLKDHSVAMPITDRRWRDNGPA